MAAAYRQGAPGDSDGVHTGRHGELGDVPERHQITPVNADETVCGPPFLQMRYRYPHEVRVAIRQVQPHIVSLGFYPAHLLPGNESRPPGRLHGYRGK